MHRQRLALCFSIAAAIVVGATLAALPSPLQSPRTLLFMLLADIVVLSVLALLFTKLGK
jgi:hypothetical protein